ncbi:FtsX-like permease family protein [Aerococcus sanguinicola]|uniref:FtsX-like permease family protein n=3 Tax=Aerococcaceae TaxID=186827 RepID=A0A5N1GMP9_9LACT|nr:FtsX-like permease family protein [Aerococcus sanguinicola]
MVGVTMKKTALWKDSFREIKNSFSRFIALLGIIFLGAGFFVGIRAAAPNMRHTANLYFQDQHLQDLSLQVDQGLTAEDIDRVDDLEGIKAYPYRSVDREETQQESLLRFLPNFNQMGDINQYKLRSGRLPEKNDEVALDARLAEEGGYNYQIGDVIELAEPDQEVSDQAPGLANNRFTVVGFVTSPMYIDQSARGNSPIGKGSIDGFAVVQPEAFTGDLYSQVAFKLEGAEDLPAYSRAYEEEVDRAKTEVEEALDGRAEERYQKSQEDLDQEIQTAEEDLKPAQKAIQEAKDQVKAEKESLKAQEDQVKQAIDSLGPGAADLPQFAQAREGLDQGKSAINQAEEEIQEKEKDLAAGQEKLDQAKTYKEEMEAPNYQVNDRSQLSGYSEYEDNADRIAAIARVFPLIFFLVAALVSFTTMTRMVDEQRIQLGTLKALGYRSSEIAIKFLLYAGLASVTGTLLGVAVGNYLLPNIIVNAYGMLYDLGQEVYYGFYWKDFLLALSISLLTTVGPAWLVTRNSLTEPAAVLMRPKPPKQGQRILLERWTWFWQRLSFNNKISLRNLFRYKGRNAMTLIGVAGSTALLLTGFGISDSISGLADRQFIELEHAQAIVQYRPKLSEGEVDDLNQTIRQHDQVADALPLYSASYQTTDEGVNQQTVSLHALDPSSNYQDFYALADVKTGERMSLPEDGVLINHKLAKLLGIQAGDAISLEDPDGQVVDLPVKGVFESYIMHDVFMSQSVYEDFIGRLPSQNQVEIKLADNSPEVKDQVIDDLMAEEGIVTVVNIDQFRQMFNETLETLNLVTLVLIIAAAILAFIVLYSLTNINVSERIRELSTIKVLGAYPLEVTLYIYRETLLLTLAGILAGLAMGQVLTTYILQTVEVDIMIFPAQIQGLSYLYASLLTLAFSLIVMAIMHYKLKQVDMVEALKGVE